MTQPHESLTELGRVHFLGLGGAGVSAVARLMLAAGVPISGTDAKEVAVLEEFRAAGVPVRIGYAAENIPSIEQQTPEPITTLVVSSVAATNSNPEYAAAEAAGLRILHRSEGLAACMHATGGIVVSGTHGKTTTSSMIARLLHSAGLDPSFAIGSNVAGFGTNAAAGTGQWFIAEADESDGSLLNYIPEIAVITNVEADHLDHYGTAEAVDDVFAEFTSGINPGGTLVICADDPGAMRILHRTHDSLAQREITVLTYGTTSKADVRITDINTGTTSQTAVLHAAGQQATMELNAPGVYNARNAAAAVAVGLATGLDLQAATTAVGSFAGSARRFDHRGEANRISVIDDYAHHPTEVSAVLTAARQAVGPGSVHAIFQPHMFSRTRAFAEEFSQALTAADTIAVLPIYPAREEPIEGVTSELLGHPVYEKSAAVTTVVTAAEPGDIILTIGAGDVTELADDILQQLSQTSAADPQTPDAEAHFGSDGP